MMKIDALYKIKTDKLLAYGFDADVPVYLHDAGYETTNFRLELYEDGTTEIYAATHDDLTVHEYVTDMFSPEQRVYILAKLMQIDAFYSELLPNVTDVYQEESEEDE